MAPRLLLLPALLAGAAGCGREAEQEPSTPVPPPADTALVVRVDRDGPEGGADPRELSFRCPPGESSAACRAARRLRPADLEPTPPDVACTEIYGGPQTARITGRLRGERVSATFTRADGCEMNRWDAVAPLLERVN